jgi:phosphocarrier protein
MMLAAGMGSMITLETVGERSEEAFVAIQNLINNRFDEGE